MSSSSIDASRTNGSARTSSRTRSWSPSMPSVMTSPATCRLSSSAGALGHDLAVVDDREAVGQRVRLLEVVGGQEDRGPELAQRRGSRPTCGHAPAGPDRSSARRGTGRAGGGRCRARRRVGGACRPNRCRSAGRPPRSARAPRAPRRRGAGPRPCPCRTAGPGSRARRGPSRPDRSNRPAGT